MSEDFDFQKTHGTNLAKLMSLDTALDWSDEDLAEMLLHQLDVTMAFDLLHMTITEVAPSSGDDIAMSFGALLKQSNPPEKFLRLAKDFFKMHRSAVDSHLPTDISTVLYYAAITAARVRLHAKISGLNDDALQQGINWSLQRPWLAPQLKELFNEVKTIGAKS